MQWVDKKFSWDSIRNTFKVSPWNARKKIFQRKFSKKNGGGDYSTYFLSNCCWESIWNFSMNSTKTFLKRRTQTSCYTDFIEHFSRQFSKKCFIIQYWTEKSAQWLFVIKKNVKVWGYESPFLVHRLIINFDCAIIIT